MRLFVVQALTVLGSLAPKAVAADHLNILFAIVMTVMLSAGLTQGQGDIGSWGDQGDSTYVNPILNGDYPDVDVEQVGDTYYMISSTQHFSPGMVILESKDMVNWTTIGHVWDRLSWGPQYNWDRMAGYPYGVYAGDFAYHDGRWYCYGSDRLYGIYMSSAEDIRGPWTEPHLVLPKEITYNDPAVFWDEEEGQTYLICNSGSKLKSEDNKTPGNENHIYKLSADGREVLDSGTVYYTGPGAEAAKIYKIDGVWYIFMAERQNSGEGGNRKQIVLRSRTDSIYGPYDKKTVMEGGNGIDRSCSQGGLMQAPDGSWWYTHQLIQDCPTPFEGRPQCLQPVTWIDGWPIIGEDIDNDGIGEPVLSHRKPIQGFTITAPPSDDEFDASELGPQWEWNHDPRDTHWSLTERPGWLRLKAARPVQDEDFFLPPDSVKGRDVKGKDTDFWRACNTLSQRIMGTTTGTAVARFDLSGMQPGQRAGFVRFGGVYHLCGVKVDESRKRRLFFMDLLGTETTGPEFTSNDLYIRTENIGDRAVFEFSSNGTDFQRFGPEFTIQFGRWTGDRLGFFCWNDLDPGGHLDIDYFHYEYDGPKSQ